MKRLLVILALVLALVGLMAFSAQATFTLTFDEWGNGFVSVNGGPITSSPGAFGTSPYGYANALYYNLPETVGVGLVPIFEQGTTSFNYNFLSDALLFEPTKMWFFSGPADEVPAPPAELSAADWANLMTQTFQGTIFVTESGIEGKFVYEPGGNVYIGYSDARVPVPPTAILLGSGLLGLVSWRRFRKG
jgi:hypothetical protein